MNKKQAFRSWLMAHLGEDTPFGDLARDAKQDSSWTGTGSTSLYWAMVDGGACFEAMQTLKEAKQQYRRSHDRDMGKAQNPRRKTSNVET